MKDFKSNEDRIEKKEDSLSASKVDANSVNKPVDDAFKTANRKHKLEWKEPQDEQMYDDRSLSGKDNDDNEDK